MAKFIALINWTEAGIKAVKDSPTRVDSARALARQMGGDLEQIFLTMGAYDMVAVLDMPDDEAAATFALRSAAGGHIRTTTLKAFDEDGFRQIVGSV